MGDPASQKMTRRPRPRLALLKPAPVLITESADEFSCLHDDLKDEFKPHGVVEQFKVEEMANLIWEIRRYRHAKTTTINSAYREALTSLLERVCREQGQSVSDIEVETDELAHQWFDNDKGAKQVISEKLAYFGLDQHAIEAEAMRLMAPDLENFDRILTSLEWRWEKALRSFAEFRGLLGRYLRESAERLIDGEVLAVGSTSKKSPSAAA